MNIQHKYFKYFPKTGPYKQGTLGSNLKSDLVGTMFSIYKIMNVRDTPANALDLRHCGLKM